MQNNQTAEVVDHQEEEVALDVCCNDEDLDWNNGSQENQEDANGSAQADEYLLEGTTLRT